jgi:hypothetical protein
MQNYDSLEISEELKRDILVNLIEPSYKSDISSSLKLKKKFKLFGLTFETMSKLFLGISSITSFASGIYKYQLLAFFAGTSSVISLVLLQYSSFSYRESKKLTNEINNSLKKLNIQLIPQNILDDNSVLDTPVSPTHLPRISTIKK